MLLEQFNRYLSEVRMISATHKHIAAHATMECAFLEAVSSRPELVVELGTGVKGIRTQAMVRASALFGADHLSVDLKDCSGCGNDWYQSWKFYQSDARLFAGVFQRLEVVKGRKADILFIDLDEKYQTTCETLDLWLPLMAHAGTLMMRCTNLGNVLFYADGSHTNRGWNNERGVIRALEDKLGIRFDETKIHEGLQDGWFVKHWPWGAGLTVLRRLEK